VRSYNQEYGATVLLTSHYMADVTELCPRVMVIHRGRIHYDGNLAGLTARFATTKTVTVSGENLPREFDGATTVIESTADRLRLEVPPSELGGVVARLLANYQIDDLSIEDPPIEDVIEQVFAEAGTD
jgi:ABC-2 type transport system ATP-binding protein